MGKEAKGAKVMGRWGASGTSTTSKLCREKSCERVGLSPFLPGLADCTCLHPGTGENRGTFWAKWRVLRGNSQRPSSPRVGCSTFRPLLLCYCIRSYTFTFDLLGLLLWKRRLRWNIWGTQGGNLPEHPHQISPTLSHLPSRVKIL